MSTYAARTAGSLFATLSIVVCIAALGFASPVGAATTNVTAADCQFAGDGELTTSDGGVLSRTVSYESCQKLADGTYACNPDESGNATYSVTCSNGARPLNTTPQTVACQANGIADRIGCAFVSIIIALIAAVVSIFTLILDIANAAFNYAIQSTIVDFGSWYHKLEDPIKKGWELFRDLANIGIIGLFVFIAISIILGLQEYGQKKLIARVVIVATLINFSFLFTIIAINASNALATAVYKSFPQDKTPTSTEVKGIGDQFLQYMGVKSYLQTQNTLMTQYNNPASSFFAVLSYALLVVIFVLAASFVLFYGAFLLFSRFILLVILLLLSAAAFATYLSPSLSETAWKSWWHSLLRNAFLAPILMVFLLISINVAAALSSSATIGAGAAFSFENFIADPTKSNLWQMLFGFIAILGVLYGGMYVASQMASGAALRLANVSAGMAGGATGGMGAWFGRNTFGRAAAIRAKAYGGQADQLTKDIAAERAKERPDFKRIAQWERQYDYLRKKQGKAEATSKKTFDLRGTAGISSLLKASGAPAALSDATKKNYAQIAKDEAKHAAEEASKATLKRGDAENIARQQIGSSEEDKARADQESKDARAAVKQAREDGLRNIEQHKQEARDAEERKRDLQERHAAAPSADLERQIREQDARLERARDQETAARTHMERTVETHRPKMLNYNQRIKAKTDEILGANRERVGDIAAHHAVARPVRDLYDMVGAHPNGHVSKLAREAATGLAKNKEDWDKKKKEREYTSPPSASGSAPAGDAHPPAH